MTQPELIELAASIADYCVTNEYPFSYTTELDENGDERYTDCLLYTSPSPRDRTRSRMPSSA